MAAKKAIFLSWAQISRRSQLISKKLGIKHVNVFLLKHVYALSPLRYYLQTLRTIKILALEKPDIVFVQNPPILAPLIVYLYARLRNAHYIIDSHTGALMAWWWKWSLPLHSFLSRRALATIVTNEYLKSKVGKWNARAFIIADIPTTFPESESYPVGGKFNIAVVNTFSPDEPLEEVLAAAKRMPDTHFYITGDTVLAKSSLLRKPQANIHFTGFIPDPEYIALLNSVDAIMVLTTDNYTMQRGACEAVSLGKPIITSNWPVLREYFSKGTVFVDNTAAGIARGIREMKRDIMNLKHDVICLQKQRRQEWLRREVELQKLLDAVH
jgi:glycosyltransferase involved in cell wall biosynthesis